MNSREAGKQRYFTVEEANATLPLVSAIVRDYAQLWHDVTERRERLSLLTHSRGKNRSDPYQEEVEQIEDELRRDSEQLREYVEELEAIGVVPKTPAEGLVDYPAIVDGREVFLCWRLGEPEVLFWHELDAGYRGRQPLAAGAASEGMSPDSGSQAD